MTEETVLAIIGGSGLYEMDGLEDLSFETVETPWGPPSDAIAKGRIDGVNVMFLARHGRGHHLNPSEINYRANIDALKRLGATDVLSVSACGSFREDLAPGAFVIVDQFIDRTFARKKTFFEGGVVAHVSMADPVCPRLASVAAAGCAALDIPHQEGGVYLAMEGPQFSTRAESELYRTQWGCDVIGMTNMPEAKLAREAELPYATVAMVTDYDCWHDGHDDVDVVNVLEVLKANAEKARGLVRHVAGALGPRRTPSPLGIEKVLDVSLLTASDAIAPEVKARLDAVAGRLWR